MGKTERQDKPGMQARPCRPDRPHKPAKALALLLAACLLLAGPAASYASSELGSSTITVEVPSTHTLSVTAAEGVSVTYGSGGSTDGSTSYDVPRLDAFTLTVEVESGYAVAGIYLDGEDVTSQLVGEVLTLSGIHADSSLVIETAEVGTGINGTLYDLPEQEFPDETLLYKVAVEVTGLAEVPKALSGIESLNTVEKITSVLQSILIEQSGYLAENMVVYEVTLVVSADEGETWEAATEENFPKGGLTVVLPYPEGTAKDTHEFAAVHMFTSTALGNTPGDTETPDVTNTDDGLKLTVNGLSPIAIAWTVVSTETEATEEPEETEEPETIAETEEASEEPEESESASQEPESTGASGSSSASQAKTGDVDGMWIILLTGLCGGIFLVASRGRKRA